MVRTHPDPPFRLTGGLAQLGEHLLCKQGVVGSIPSTSTKRAVVISKIHSSPGLQDLNVILNAPSRRTRLIFNNLEEVC